MRKVVTWCLANVLCLSAYMFAFSHTFLITEKCHNSNSNNNNNSNKHAELGSVPQLESQGIAPALTSTVQSSPLFSSSLTCNGFFTVMSNIWLPGEDTCSYVLYRLLPVLKMQNRQMQRMNTTLKVFTTFNETQLQEPKCNMNALSNVEMVQFDPTVLLHKYGFNHTLMEWIQAWGTVPNVNVMGLVARYSDLFRILLAAEHQMAYTDLDMLYLSADPHLFWQHPNVAVPVWKSKGAGALEIQNSGFCFSRPQLHVILRYMQNLIASKGQRQAVDMDAYYYVELGPNVLQKTLQHLGAVYMYNTIASETWRVEEIVKDHETFGGFPWLHLDKSNRRRNTRKAGYTMDTLVDALWEKCPYPLPADTPNRYASDFKPETTS